jgi:hypothetical protein
MTRVWGRAALGENRLAKTRCNRGPVRGIDTGSGSNKRRLPPQAACEGGRWTERLSIVLPSMPLSEAVSMPCVAPRSPFSVPKPTPPTPRRKTFVSAWRHREALRDPDSFDAWLGRINLNACRAQLRRRGRAKVREIRLFDPEDDREPASTEPALADRTVDANAFGGRATRARVVSCPAEQLECGNASLPAGTRRPTLIQSQCPLQGRRVAVTFGH